MRISIFLLLASLVLITSTTASAQDSSLEPRVSRLEHQLNDRSGGAALFLFGAFCALWAQNTGRSAWLWFFLGLFFSVITVVVLLYKNSHDRRASTQPRATPA